MPKPLTLEQKKARIISSLLEFEIMINRETMDQIEVKIDSDENFEVSDFLDSLLGLSIENVVLEMRKNETVLGTISTLPALPTRESRIKMDYKKLMHLYIMGDISPAKGEILWGALTQEDSKLWFAQERYRSYPLTEAAEFQNFHALQKLDEIYDKHQSRCKKNILHTDIIIALGNCPLNSSDKTKTGTKVFDFLLNILDKYSLPDSSSLSHFNKTISYASGQDIDTVKTITLLQAYAEIAASVLKSNKEVQIIGNKTKFVALNRYLFTKGITLPEFETYTQDVLNKLTINKPAHVDDPEVQELNAARFERETHARDTIIEMFRELHVELQKKQELEKKPVVEPKKQEPEKQEPEKQEPEKQKPEKQKPEKQKPEKDLVVEPKKQEPKKQEPEKQKPKKQELEKKPDPEPEKTRTPPKTPTAEEICKKHKADLELFQDLLGALGDKILDLYTRNNLSPSDAIQAGKVAAETLETALKNARKLYFGKDTIPTKEDYTAFKKVCDDAIATAHTELDKHRGWSEFLVNLALAISTIGIGLLIKGAINMANNQRFFAVHETASSKMLHGFSKSIEALDPDFKPEQKPGDDLKP